MAASVDQLPPSEEEAGETSEGSSSASSMSSTGTLVPQNSAQARKPRARNPWHDYFEQELYLDVTTKAGANARYHVYVTSPSNPSRDPLFVCHHGAGASGLSFALLAHALRQKLPGSGVMAVEAREHGSVIEYTGDKPDLSLAALSEDFLGMIDLAQNQLWPELPNLVLVGHSLGGAVVTRIAKEGRLGAKLIGFAVIDVVEGSAMEALKSMQSYLRTRPTTFPSVDAAIDWHVRSRTIRNALSASISTPPLVIESKPDLWTWKTDLSATSFYWEDWFTGMSPGFLSGKAAKLLLLAGTDRLDKDLMIGQMQGKFQLHVFPEAGHFVHEDLPEKTADVLLEFYRRNDRSTMVLPPKVSDLLAQGKKV